MGEGGHIAKWPQSTLPPSLGVARSDHDIDAIGLGTGAISCSSGWIRYLKSKILFPTLFQVPQWEVAQVRHESSNPSPSNYPSANRIQWPTYGL